MKWQKIINPLLNKRIYPNQIKLNLLKRKLKSDRRDYTEETYVIDLDRYEKGTIINALNHLRNKLLEDGISTDSVDDIILKILDAPLKKKGLSLSRFK